MGNVNRLRRSLVVLAALIVVVAAAGGFAYARATGDTVINACAKAENGQLRLDTGSGCRPSENPIQWNQAGPQGIPGPQGIQGPQGPAGVTNADERFFARSITDQGTWLRVRVGTWPDVRPSMTHVTTSHLVPGNYTISAEVLASNYAGVGVLVCLLGNPSVGYTLAQTGLGNGGGFSIQQTIVAQGIFPLPQGGDIDLSCFSAPQGDSPAGDPRVGYADVIAATPPLMLTATVRM